MNSSGLYLWASYVRLYISQSSGGGVTSLSVDTPGSFFCPASVADTAAIARAVRNVFRICIYGIANATNSPGELRPDTATTMNCLPLTMYVIGELLTPADSSVSQTIFPVFLSNARNFLPPNPAGTPTPVSAPSPMNTSVLVTIAALRPGVPMAGRFSPLNAG